MVKLIDNIKCNALGNFVITKVTACEHYFNLTAVNYKVILTSRIYSSPQDCVDGIACVKKNCSYDLRFEYRQSLNNKYHLVLKVFNGQIIGTGEKYESNRGMENGIEYVKKNCGSTKVVEE